MLNRLMLYSIITALPFSASAANNCSSLFDTSLNKQSIANPDKTSLPVTFPDVASAIKKFPKLPNIMNIPQNLKPIALEVMLRIMGVDLKNPNYTSISHSSYTIVDAIRMTGMVPEKDLKKIGEATLQKIIDTDLIKNIQSDKAQPRIEHTSNIELPKTEKSFYERYDLGQFKNIHDVQESLRKQEHTFPSIDRKINLADAYRLAFSLKSNLVKPLLSELVYRRHYEVATEAAEQVKDYSSLLDIGLLSLNDYLSPGKYFLNLNNIYYAINALMRVRGELKPDADAVLFDLSKMLSSDSHIDFVAKTLSQKRESTEKYLLQDAIKALRNTGEPIFQYDEAGHTYIVTKISDSTHVKALKALLKTFEEKKYHLSISETVHYEIAKLSIGEPESSIYGHINIDRVKEKMDEDAKNKKEWEKYFDSIGLSQSERTNPFVLRIINEISWDQIFAKDADPFGYENLIMQVYRDRNSNPFNSYDRLIRAMAIRNLLPEDQVKKIESDKK